MDNKVLRKRFDAYELHRLLEVEEGVWEQWDPEPDPYPDLDDESVYSWGLYGHVTGEGLHVITMRPTLDEVVDLYERITGEAY